MNIFKRLMAAACALTVAGTFSLSAVQRPAENAQIYAETDTNCYC